VGSLEGLAVGLYLEVAFRLRTGRVVSVCLDRGLVLVEACSLSRTGEARGCVGVSGFLMGEPSGDDLISSTTRGPYLVVLLLLTHP